MIIEEVKGNAVSMFLRGEGHLIHGCNCFNSMGAGIAKEVKQRIKGAYQLDQKTKKGDSRKLGIRHRKVTMCSTHIHSLNSGEKKLIWLTTTQYRHVSAMLRFMRYSTQSIRVCLSSLH